MDWWRKRGSAWTLTQRMKHLRTRSLKQVSTFVRKDCWCLDWSHQSHPGSPFCQQSLPLQAPLRLYPYLPRVVSHQG
eukprot:symbB.v1.2.020784.t1/scaffold1766.1/size102418/3